MHAFRNALLARLPPWWGRLFGAPVVRGLAAPLDVLAQDTADSVKLKFPTATLDAPALALIGKERRIVRGPDEAAGTYAARLRLWLDSHRTRGNAYALLGQLFAYWQATLNVPIEVVNANGGRASMDIAGAITHDVVNWTGGGSLATFWAQSWVFYHVPAALEVAIAAGTGDEIIAGTGDVVIGSIALSAGVLPPTIEESFKVIPREWAPAHQKRCTVVLLYGTGRVLGYGGGTLGDGHVLGADPPLQLTIDM